MSDSRTRLVEATLCRWSEGILFPSAREIAERARLSPSAINYYYRSIERLYRAAAEQAHGRAVAWCESMVHRAADVGSGSGSALGALLGAVIDDWCWGERELAIAWRRAQLVALRDPSWIETAAKWQNLWSSTWARLCGHLGLGKYALLVELFFEAESFQHLVRSNRLIDRPALGEFCDLFAARINGTAPSAASPWRERASVLTEIPSETEFSVGAARIARAALITLGKLGAAALTHRAVAAEGGVSPGAVAHHFSTVRDLMHAAYRALLASRTEAGRAVLETKAPMTPAAYRGVLLSFAISDMPRAESLAIDEMAMAMVSDASTVRLARLMRYGRGRTSHMFLSRMPKFDGKVTVLDGALLSTWLQGLRRSNALTTKERRLARAESAIDEYFDLLTAAPLLR